MPRPRQTMHEIRARTRPTVTLPGCVLMLIIFAGSPGAGAAQTSAPPPADLPAAIPLFPLPDVALFPHSTQPFHIFEPRYRDMVADALAGDSIIGMVLLRPGFEAQYDGRPPIYAVGCAGVIVDSERLPDGRYNIVLRGLAKFRVLSEDQARTYRLASIEMLPEAMEIDPAVLAESRRELEEALLSSFPGARRPRADLSDEEVIDGLSLFVPIEPVQRQELLEADGAVERASSLVRLLLGGRQASL